MLQPLFEQGHGIKANVFPLLEFEQQLHDLCRKTIVLGLVRSIFLVAKAGKKLFFEYKVVDGVIHQAFQDVANGRTVRCCLAQFIVQGVGGIYEPVVLFVNGGNAQLQGFGPGHEGHGGSLIDCYATMERRTGMRQIDMIVHQHPLDHPP